ncbi:MAG: YqaA family protein, partial [Gammaproteobacteria bacterium]|nr:YqaA family protein [Gammaproteobacteria bacterium]
MSDEAISLWSLFSSAFLSATLLPGSSEILLAYLVANSSVSLSLLLTAATVGNTLGGFTTYLLGRFLAWRFPNKALRKEHHTAIARLQHWGSLTLLLSWVPIIGDPLCAAAGYLKLNPVLTVVLLAIGKAARYVFIIWAIPGS